MVVPFYTVNLCSLVSVLLLLALNVSVLKICDSGAVSYLIVCVYMPGFIDSSSYLEYQSVGRRSM